MEPKRQIISGSGKEWEDVLRISVNLTFSHFVKWVLPGPKKERAYKRLASR